MIKFNPPFGTQLKPGRQPGLENVVDTIRSIGLHFLRPIIRMNSCPVVFEVEKGRLRSNSRAQTAKREARAEQGILA